MSEPNNSEEGEFSEQSNHGSDIEVISQPGAILPVGKFSKEFTPESLPTSGEEYLCLVRHQAHHLSHPNLPEIPIGSIVGPEQSFGTTSGFAPIPVNQEQVDAAVTHFTSHKANTATNPTETLKQALKGDLSSLFRLNPDALSPSQISDLRRMAKEIGANNVEFVITVATCFGQRDLITIQ